jgi:hypothetical protein
VQPFVSNPVFFDYRTWSWHYDKTPFLINIERSMQPIFSIGSADSQAAIKADFIDRIGPWAFQSFSKSKWHQVSDEDIIEGALVSAPEQEKRMLLNFYSLPEILRVWKSKVVIQDKWLHSNNVWIAENLFKQRSPEKFVNLAFLDASKQRERQLEHARIIARR